MKAFWRTACAGLVCAALLVAGSSLANQFPDRPIRIISGFAAGSSGDAVSRLVSNHMSRTLGQPLVNEGRPGASGNIAAQHVARSTPDGYTLLLGSSTNVANTVLQPDLPVDFIKDFAPVVLLGAMPNILVVHPSLGVSTVGELIALAKSKPEQIFYGSVGIGSSQHLSSELFNTMAGTKLVPVRYQGSGQATTDLLAGRISLMFAPPPSVVAHIESGALKALASTRLQRASFLPNLPTMSEAGVPGFDTSIWMGYLAPAGTPREVVEALSRAANEALKAGDVVTGLNRLGMDPIGGTPQAFADYIASETTRWNRIARAAGLVK